MLCPDFVRVSCYVLILWESFMLCLDFESFILFPDFVSFNCYVLILKEFHVMSWFYERISCYVLILKEFHFMSWFWERVTCYVLFLWEFHVMSGFWEFHFMSWFCDVVLYYVLSSLAIIWLRGKESLLLWILYPCSWIWVCLSMSLYLFVPWCWSMIEAFPPQSHFVDKILQRPASWLFRTFLFKCNYTQNKKAKQNSS